MLEFTLILDSGTVYHGFEPPSGQTKDYNTYMCCFSTKHTASINVVLCCLTHQHIKTLYNIYHCNELNVTIYLCYA